MDGKMSLRYKSSFIVSVIVLFSIISAILINNLQIDFIKSGVENDLIHQVSFSNLDYTFFTEGYNVGNRDDVFQYNLKLIEKMPISNQDTENGLEDIKYSDEPITRRSTNIDKKLLNDEKEPHNIAYNLPKEKKLFWIKGLYDNEKLDYSSNLDEFSGDNKNRAKIFLEATVNFYGHGHNRDDHLANGEEGFSYYSFFYTFDVDNAKLISDINNNVNFAIYSILLVVISLITSLIFAFYIVFINFESAKKHKTFDGIINIPIDIYILGLFFLFVAVGSTFDNIPLYPGPSSQTLEKLNKLVMVKYTIAFFLNVFAILYSTYIVLGLKSIYYDGFSSFIFEKSIIVKILRYFYKILVKAVKKINRFITSFDPASRVILLVMYLVCVFIAILISGRYSSFSFLLLMLIGITYVFLQLKVYQDNYREIEEVSKEISLGDYSLKIDVEKNRFKKLAENLNASSDSLALAMEKELKSEKLKTELITNVSHDLKTPLTSIINYSHLINDDKTSSDDIKKYARVINEKSNKLRELIEGLFELSKVSSSNVKFNIDKIDYKELINQIAGEWEDKFSEINLKVIINYPDENVFVNLDGHQSSRILENIFSNIYKYTLEDTRVYIDLLVDERTRLIVKNISKYQLNISPEDLLERFVRGDDSRNTDGSGLGLSIASSLTKLQGGDFKIDIVGDLFIVTIEF